VKHIGRITGASGGLPPPLGRPAPPAFGRVVAEAHRPHHGRSAA